MRIELVVVRDCRHEEAAGALLRRALDDIGLGSLSFEVIVVESPSMADEMHFLGSPTFMVEGRDLFDEPAGERPWRAGSIPEASHCRGCVSCVAR